MEIVYSKLEYWIPKTKYGIINKIKWKNMNIDHGKLAYKIVYSKLALVVDYGKLELKIVYSKLKNLFFKD